MSFEGACPACGQTLLFRFETSLLAVCPFCNVAVARKGADLAAYGRVAEPLATPTLLALDLRGKLPDGRGFTIAGRLQLDYGAGAWDEWHLAFDDGTFAWLAEAQGKFTLMRPAALPQVPPFSSLAPGARLTLGKIGAFVVTERRAARFMTAQGQLPTLTPPGAALNYADLSGPGGYVGTLDYGEGDAAEALYVGKAVSLEEIGMELPDAAATPASRRAAGQKLGCPKCGGPIEILVPDQTQRVACSFCGALLDATGSFAVLEVLAIKVKPKIPLGRQGEIGGVTWTAIGFMIRSTVVEGVRYPWREYLLYEPAHGFAWLVESNGHWSFVETVPAGDVDGESVPLHDGIRYKHFQSCTARVDQVLGEFYWAVAEGEKTNVDDHVSPPYVLSRERSGTEITWSRGTYIEPEDVWSAFHLEGDPPESTGVGSNQVWVRKQELERTMLVALVAVIAMTFVFLGFRLTGKVVHRDSFQLPAHLTSGTDEAMAFTSKFTVPTRGNVEVKVEAPVSNSWLYLDGALINEEAGVFTPFDMEISYYSGSDWTEGSRHASRFLGSVAPGSYELRFAPQWEAAKNPGSYDVTVTARKPRFLHLLAATLVVAIWPLALAWSGLRFENRRWSESDHPLFASSEED